MGTAPKQPEVWWWTLTKFDGDCHECGNVIDAGSVVAWNHGMRIELCQPCGERHNPAMSRTARRHFSIPVAPTQKTKVKASPRSAESRAQRAWARPHALTVACSCGAIAGETCHTRSGKGRKPHSSRVGTVARGIAAGAVG